MSDMRKPILLVLIALLCAAFAAAVSNRSSLKFTVPAGWVEEERTSSMRVAQYRLPKAAGDTEDASLVLYYFGQGQGGSTAANIERWVGQMKQADGSASKDKAKEESFDVNGLKVTTVDVVRNLRCGDCTRKRRHSTTSPATVCGPRWWKLQRDLIS